MSVNASGITKEFYKDSTLMSSFGMKIDASNNLLWVCTGDPNYSIYSTPATKKKLARLVAIDLATASKKYDIDLSGTYTGEHFANDLTLDDAGNIYVTDSYSPVIYKIDNRQKVTVFAINELFRSPDVGLNGIVWFPGGYLLAVNNSNGSILKIDTRTATVSKVKTDNFFPGADGLGRVGTDLLMVVNKGIDKVFRISSTDNWATAKIVASTAAEDRFQNPSTIVESKNKWYVVNSKLNEITDRSKKPSEEFSFQLVSLK